MSDLPPLRASVRRRDGMAIIDLTGELDGFADRPLKQAYAEAMAAAPTRLLLTFDGVSHINSTGIAVIVSLLAQARRDKIAVLCSGLNDHYQEIFRITRLADFARVFRDEDAAFAAT